MAATLPRLAAEEYKIQYQYIDTEPLFTSGAKAVLAKIDKNDAEQLAGDTIKLATQAAVLAILARVLSPQGKMVSPVLFTAFQSHFSAFYTRNTGLLKNKLYPLCIGIGKHP